MSTEQHQHLALISMPWALFNRPSIQLGALKAYIEAHSNIEVRCYHPYLEVAKSIGVEEYRFISKNGWAGDALYSALLFPENREEAFKLYQESCKANKEVASQFDSICNALAHTLEDWCRRTDFSNCKLIGFSVCFNQLFSSLFAAKVIKLKSPHLQVVFGGSSCVGEMGTSLLNEFDQVDHVIAGEGENQLLELCNTVFTETPASNKIADESQDGGSPVCRMMDLNSLPVPDYQPYFAELQEYFPGLPFSPRMPLEFSRGCWWNKCAFCNLNLQWHGYRKKKAEKVADEVRTLHARHSILDFTFCDNALPEKEADSLFSALRNIDVDFDFFAEIRPLNDPAKLKLYRHGGLSMVQVGIESLSNSLLKKMAKGLRVIENLAIMKHCAENDIQLDGNLIVEFPGSTDAEVLDTMVNLDYALPYNPLEAATFFLGTGSPVETAPADFGIRSVTNHRNANKLLPKEILTNVKLVVRDYRGDRGKQRKLWQPVRRKIKQWQDFHRHRKDASLPPLSYRDGGSFLIIRQERVNGSPLLHRLQGTSRKLYLFCSTIKDLDDILQEFNVLKEKTILHFFDDLCKKHLLFQENRKYLALAIRAR